MKTWLRMVVVLVLAGAALAGGGRSLFAHCSLPCGYYDWDHEFHSIEYAAETLGALAKKKAGQPDDIVYVARAAFKNEDWGTMLQEKIRLFAFEYFTPEELIGIKIGDKTLLEVMHAADKQAYVCKQSLSVDEARKMLKMVEQIEGAYEQAKAQRTAEKNK